MESQDAARSAAPAPAGGMASRAAWTMLDQGISSIANAALSIVLARQMSSTEFGTFALAFSLYSFLIGISRALSGQVLIIRFVGRSQAAWQRATGLAAGTSVVLGAVSGVVFLGAMSIWQLPAASVAVVVALFLPVLLLQDAWRTVLISAGTPRAAFVNDLVWTVLQFVAIAILLVRQEQSASWFVLAWSVSAGVAALLGLRQVRQRPLVAGTVGWLRDHRDLTGYLLAQWVAVLGMTQVAFFVLASVGGVEVVGSLRAAQTLLGPLTLFGMAVNAFVAPELVRAKPGKAALVRALWVTSGVCLVVDAAWGVLLLLIPDSLGMELLGATWPSASRALPGMVTFTCAVGVTTGPALLFVVRQKTQFVFVTGAVLGPAILVFSVLGQILFGVAGAAWGFALAAAVVMPVFALLSARCLASMATSGSDRVAQSDDSA